jgi:hypothetical protein
LGQRPGSGQYGKAREQADFDQTRFPLNLNIPRSITRPIESKKPQTARIL